MHGGHTLRQPLAQELAGTIHDGDTAVAVAPFAVGNVNVAILRIDKNARGHKENRSLGIERFSFDRAVGGIDRALLANLKEHLAAVMRIFLDHP